MPDPTFTDYNAWRFWLELLLAASALGATIFGWWVTSTRATRASIDAVEKDFTSKHNQMHAANATLKSELDRLVTKVNNLPDHDDIGKVYERLAAVDGQLNKLIGSVDALTRQFATVHSYLLNTKER